MHRLLAAGLALAAPLLALGQGQYPAEDPAGSVPTSPTTPFAGAPSAPRVAAAQAWQGGSPADQGGSLSELRLNGARTTPLLTSLQWTNTDEELRPPRAAVHTDGPAPVAQPALSPGSARNASQAGRAAPSVLRGGILGQGTNTALPVRFHGGPVVTTPQTMYLIWYGDWSGRQDGQGIIQSFLTALGQGAPWLDMIRPYTDRAGTPPATTFSVGGAISDFYSQGQVLSEAAVLTIVSNAVLSGVLPYSPNNIYWVMGAQDVSDSGGFCRTFCGYHNILARAGVEYHFGFVGDTSHCPGACQPQSPGPNGPGYIDGTISILAHEVSEALSDPRLNAWFDDSGSENADKCSWKYGATYAAPNGARANAQIGGQNYLLQQQWVNSPGQDGGFCASSLPAAPVQGQDSAPARPTRGSGQLITSGRRLKA